MYSFTIFLCLRNRSAQRETESEREYSRSMIMSVLGVGEQQGSEKEEEKEGNWTRVEERTAPPPQNVPINCLAATK